MCEYFAELTLLSLFFFFILLYMKVLKYMQSNKYVVQI
jgi:hypothetical protein